MNRLLVILAFCFIGSIVNAQGTASAQLLAEQLDDLAVAYSEPIEVMQRNDKAMITAPTSTYLLEVIDQEGKVVAQDPFNTFLNVNTQEWKAGTYIVLAHTFNGLKQLEFKLKAPAASNLPR